MSDVPRLLGVLEAIDGIEITRAEPIADVAAFAALVKPHFGRIDWAPPPSYAAALASFGPFSARRGDVAIVLFGADEIGRTNEDLVHLPEGVSRDEGVYLSTNHLVGFADAGGDAVWCFDVTQGTDGEYPVYYHHQDEPRARILASGEWEEPDNSTPDFPSFAHWLEKMAADLTRDR